MKHDISDLPTPEVHGDPPRRPRMVTKLAETWAARFGNEFAAHALPDAGPYRMSWASVRCDRTLQYLLAKVDKSNPPNLADIYRMNLGTIVHRAFQEVMAEAFGDDWEDEIVIDLNTIGIPGSGRIDGAMQIELDPGPQGEDLTARVPVELKTINGFGFKMSATPFKNPPQGPRSGHRLQLAYAIVALDAPYGILGYLSLENIGKDVYDRMKLEHPAEYFSAEWAVSRDEAEQLVATEAKRIDRVLRFTNTHDVDEAPIARIIHDPELPPNATVIDPTRGTWATMVDGKPTQTGKTWMCRYCDFRGRCAADGEGWTQLELGEEEPF